MLAQSPITIPLPQTAHDLATQFAAEQKIPQKGTQVYLNTLSVYAVHCYLKWFQVESDLMQGDSWHPALRSLLNTADLVIPGIGKLECRPVLPGTEEVAIPAEVSDNRIGYIAVQLSEDLHQVQLTGFMPSTALSDSPELIKIQDFQPLDTLLDYLAPALIPTPSGRIELQQWFQNIFAAGWQSIETLIGAQPELAYVRSDLYPIGMLQEEEAVIKGAKLIDLGVQLGNQCVVLLVAIAPDAEKGYRIVIQLHPAAGQSHLPTPLKFSLLSQSGNQLQEVQARDHDNFIQMRPFWGQAGESFTIQIRGDVVNLMEYFTI
jgi:hypothetical protein